MYLCIYVFQPLCALPAIVLFLDLSQPEVPNQDMKPGSKELQILIPEQFMGVIIGRGGDKIRELRARTDASVKVRTDISVLED